MASHSLAIESLITVLKHNGPFKRDAIREFYERRGEVLTDNLLAVRINRLKKMGVLAPLAKGLYEISKITPFHPEFSSSLKRLNKKLSPQFPMTKILFWETTWMNEFITLQLVNNWTIIEVESNAEDSIFETVHGFEPNRTFLNPAEKEMDLYLSKKENPIIIKTLLTGSPKVKIENVAIPKLEKILVDLHYDKFLEKVFSAEKSNILNEAFQHYSINYTTLLNYAARRGKKEEMAKIVKESVDGFHWGDALTN